MKTAAELAARRIDGAPDLYYPLKDLREMVRKVDTDEALALIDAMLDACRLCAMAATIRRDLQGLDAPRMTAEQWEQFDLRR